MNRQSVLCAIAIVLLAINQLLLASAVAATLAGHPVQGGATLRLSISDQQILPGLSRCVWKSSSAVTLSEVGRFIALSTGFARLENSSPLLLNSVLAFDGLSNQLSAFHLQLCILCALEFFLLSQSHFCCRSSSLRRSRCRILPVFFVFQPRTIARSFFVTRANFTRSAKMAGSRDV